MIFGFPPVQVPFVDPTRGVIEQAWHLFLVQMSQILGTINYGTADGVAFGTSAVILTMKIGQVFRVAAFDAANSANNAKADVFYDGTTLTLENLTAHGVGVSITVAGANVQVANTNGVGSISINWRVS